MPDNEKKSKEWKQTVVPDAKTATPPVSVSTVSVIVERIRESKWTKVGVVIGVVMLILWLIDHFKVFG